MASDSRSLMLGHSNSMILGTSASMLEGHVGYSRAGSVMGGTLGGEIYFPLVQNSIFEIKHFLNICPNSTLPGSSVGVTVTLSMPTGTTSHMGEIYIMAAC